MKAGNTPAQVALNNILVATDFSPPSQTALFFALSLVRRFGATLFLAHVAPPGSDAASLERARQEAQQLATDLFTSGHLRGVLHKVLVAQGEVCEALAPLIQEHSIDLIAIGTRGRSGAGKTSLGSVAECVFRRTPRAVLTVRPDFPSEPLHGSGLRRILYAADFTPQSLHAAPYAVSVAQGFQAQLTMLHVIQEPARTPRGPKGRPLEEAKSRLRDLIPEAADLPSEPDLIVGFGTPAARILDVAAEKNPDLIVLGVSQPGSAESHPWATASEVVAKAACPVLTVRAPEM